MPPEPSKASRRPLPRLPNPSPAPPMPAWVPNPAPSTPDAAAAGGTGKVLNAEPAKPAKLRRVAVGDGPPPLSSSSKNGQSKMLFCLRSGGRGLRPAKRLGRQLGRIDGALPTSKRANSGIGGERSMSGASSDRLSSDPIPCGIDMEIIARQISTTGMHHHAADVPATELRKPGLEGLDGPERRHDVDHRRGVIRRHDRRNLAERNP